MNSSSSQLPPLQPALEEPHHDDHQEDPESEAEFRRFFPSVDLRKIRLLLGLCSIMLFVLSIIVIILASLNSDVVFRTSFTVAGVVSLVTSFASVYGVWSKDRGGLQFSYVLLIWGMAHATSYLFQSIGTKQKFKSSCSSFPDMPGCNSQEGIAGGQVAMAVLMFFLQLAMSWLTSNYSEKVQDATAAFQRERDIRFAIENAAMKMRVAKRWKKAYAKVIGDGGDHQKPQWGGSDPYAHQQPYMGAGAAGGAGPGPRPLPPLNPSAIPGADPVATSSATYADQPPRPSASGLTPDRPEKPRKRVVATTGDQQPAP